MNIEEFRNYCLAKAGATEDLPFGPDVLVFKVGGKIFALTNINTFDAINLKCQPERALELREQYAFIRPGYHMSKKHWNTVLLDQTIGRELLQELTDHSYALVFAGLPRLVKRSILGPL